MDAIYNLLDRHRLQSYYNKFVELGVKDERDFIDSVTDEDLKNFGKITGYVSKIVFYRKKIV